MAVQRKKAKPQQPTQSIIEYVFGELAPYRRELMGTGFLALATITFLSFFSENSWAIWWADASSQLFGWGVLPITVLFVIFGGLLAFGRLKEEYEAIPFDIVIGIELLILTSLSLAHILAALFSGTDMWRLAASGVGGGFIGWGVSSFLLNLIGLVGTILFLIVISGIGLGLTFRLTKETIIGWLGMVNAWAKHHHAKLQQHRPPTFTKTPLDDYTDEADDFVADVVYLPPTDSAMTITSLEKGSQGQPLSDTVSMIKPGQTGKKSTAKQGKLWKDPAAGQATRLAVPAHVAKKALSTMPKRKHKLPSLELMEASSESYESNPEAERLAGIIEKTLNSFDIPAKVKYYEPGPTVTQFAVELGTISKRGADGEMVERRVRVRKVTALTNDLALALSATPIRIEAPIPGRPYVGIEVPNKKKTFVSLRGVMATKEFRNVKAPLQIGLGRGTSGDAAVVSLMKMPHLLIAGATGSGKSVCLNTLISTLIFMHSPEQLRMLMIDPKMVELTSFNGIPHLIAPVVTDFEQVVGALSWATREMERRYKLFAKIGARSIISYNQKVGSDDEKLPFLVVIIDELADLMMMAPDEVERHICRIAQMARATGIHLVIATQRPSTDVITGLIKANFPARIAFAVTSQIDSRVILDTPGAEKLLGQGDMLYMAPDSPTLTRLQGCFISDTEIQNLVNFWKQNQASPTKAVSKEEVKKLPWTDIMAEADKDDLLEEAVKLVIETRRASASFLQRRLGIGYPRASRLLDQLEEEGVIGAADGSKPREVLWKNDKDEANYAEFEEDVAGTVSG